MDLHPLPNGGRRIEFYKDPVTDQDKIKYMFPSDRNFEPHFLVEEKHKIEFPREWEAYREGQSQLVGQTPLTDIAWIDGAMRNMFGAHHVLTLEQLAALGESALSVMSSTARKLHARAVVEVENKQKVAAHDAAMAEVTALRQRIEELERRPAPKGRTRKPEQEHAAA